MGRSYLRGGGGRRATSRGTTAAADGLRARGRQGAQRPLCRRHPRPELEEVSVVRLTARTLSVLIALLMVRAAGAQVIPGNENDLQLNNGVDIAYIYDDPSIGPAVGTSGVPDFATNTWYWKVMPKETLLHRTGVMEVTGLDIWTFDGDYGVFENGKNTALADSFLSRAKPSTFPQVI